MYKQYRGNKCVEYYDKMDKAAMVQKKLYKNGVVATVLGFLGSNTLLIAQTSRGKYTR